MTPAEQKIAEAADAYKMKHFGRTDVDIFGRPLLTKAEIAQVSRLHKLPRYSLKTVLQKGGFE